MRPASLFIVSTVTGLLMGLSTACSPSKSAVRVTETPPSVPQTVHHVITQGAGKTAVFCLNGDLGTQRRLETQVVEVMKSQGFDAWVGRDQIPPADHYSAADLAALLRKAGFASIADVTYSGDIPPGGFPQQLSFNLHPLEKPRRARYSTLQTVLNAAVNLLFAAVIEAPGAALAR